MSLLFSPLPGIDAPLFRAERDRQTLYYAPGCLAGVPGSYASATEQHLRRSAGQQGFGTSRRISPPQPGSTSAADLCHSDSGNVASVESAIREISVALLGAAAEAVRAWEAGWAEPFTPLCLTLYPQTACSLVCTYCFANATPAGRALTLSLEAVRAAAQAVAQNCRAAGQPLTVVFHGGGEPTLDRRWVDRALDLVESVAREHELPLFRYVATHGFMSDSKAAWLAQRFDLIGLSCDGSEDIQSAQRRHSGGRSTAPYIERTARVVRQNGRPLHVRATITPASLGRQAEIATYICERLRPQEIHAEPIYQGGRAGSAALFRPEQAQEFALESMKARRVAQVYSIRWLASGSRPWEVHGPYCYIRRSVLLLVPGGAVSACFKSCDALQAERDGTSIGAYSRAGGGLRLDRERISRLLQRLADNLRVCSPCFNYYHCARACPDNCLLADDRPGGTFRCQLQRAVSAALLEETAGQVSCSYAFWLRWIGA